jgi:hypothetical protein
MKAAIMRRLAKLEAKLEGDQIPIFCDDESEVSATIDRMIAADELTESDRALCVYWLACTGPNAPSDADLKSLLAQEQNEAERRGSEMRARKSGDAD